METLTARRYAYFDHDADIGVIGRGATLEEAFVGAAEGTFALMAPRRAPRPLAAAQREIQITFEETDVALALVQWLNGLLAAARERRLLLGSFELSREGDRWFGRARGIPWRRSADRGIEVKGATLTMLAVVPERDGGWEARCVVDV